MTYRIFSIVKHCRLKRLGEIKVDSGVDSVYTSEMRVQHGVLFPIHRLRKMRLSFPMAEFVWLVSGLLYVTDCALDD